MQIILSGDSLADIAEKATALAREIGGAITTATAIPADAGKPKDKAKDKPNDKTKADLSAAEQRRLAAAATVVDSDDETAAEEDDETDPLAEDDEVALTMDDVKAVLLEVREAMPDKPSIISEIVGKFGKKKLSDLDAADYSKVVEHAKSLLDAAKAAKKNKKK